jgi:hypothetical protein
MRERAPARWPAKPAIGIGDRQIVDAGDAAPAQCARRLGGAPEHEW